MTNKQYRNFAQMQFLTGKIITAKDVENLFLKCVNLRQILTFIYLYQHACKLSNYSIFRNIEYLASINSAKIFYENYDLIKEKIYSKS